MRRLFCLVVSLLLVAICSSQTIHRATGVDDYNEEIFDSKIDPNDGGTISVGSIKYIIPSDGDVLIVKFDAAHNILWQKSIPNNGDDVFYKVKICANGDYLVAGKMVLNINSLPKAILWRVNSSTGDVIWSCIPNSSSNIKDVFWDMIETSTGMIAAVGSLTNLNKSYVALVSSDGIYSNSIAAVMTGNEFRSIAELPNGNLIVAGYLNSGSSYHYAMIVELNPTTLARISQNRYSINLAIPGGSTMKSLWPVSLSVKNNIVTLSCIAFPALSSAATAGLCVYNYNLTTRALTGNLYYQPGYSNATGYSFSPITETDFLLSQTYTSPSLHISVSRITNGTRVFDRKINGAVTNINSIHYSNGNLVCAGKIKGVLPDEKSDAYHLFSTSNLPLASSLCDVTDVNTLSSLVSNLTATSSSSLILDIGEPTYKITQTVQNTNFTIKDPCTAAPTNFTFTGDGLWSIAANWQNNVIPPAILPTGSTITISPSPGGSCILNVLQTISFGANFLVTAGTNFTVQGGLIVNQTAVTICNQVWTNKNLDVATYRNGDPIPHVTSNALWSTLTTGAYCYYNNDSATYAAIYGKLYNWYAVTDPRGLAPVGWHVPQYGEWINLINCLGGIPVAGGPAKEAGFIHWSSPNTGATNSSGFTSLPGGWRANTGTFSSVPGTIAVYWSSSESNSTNANGAGTFNDTESFNPVTYLKVGGYSVRCVKD